MELRGIKFGIGAEVYVLRDNGELVYVTANDFDDGASLIVEAYDDDGDVLSDKFWRTEACFLEPASKELWEIRYPGVAFPIKRGGPNHAL